MFSGDALVAAFLDFVKLLSAKVGSEELNFPKLIELIKRDGV